ncbi:MAG: hypothetical protein R2991_07510 [Thermoanaerobaculia bacterium]
MAAEIRKVDYYYVSLRAEPGEAYGLLARLAKAQVNLLAFSAIPMGPEFTQLVLFPEDVHLLQAVAREIGIQLTGPDHALLIQGDDELGALARIHRQLAEAGVSAYASSGVSDGAGGFGYVLYVRSEDIDRAVSALEL